MRTSKTGIFKFFLWAMTMVLLPMLSIVQGESLKMGYFKVPPHAMPGSRERPVGVAVEYFLLIAREMQLTDVTFIQYPLNRLLIELESNRIDMGLLLARNEERARQFVYPAHPFCVTKPSIAVHKTNPMLKINTVEDLIPLTFLETPGNYRTAIMQDKRLRIEPLSGKDFTRRCYGMILADRIDACYQPDHYPIQFEAVQEEHASGIKILYLPDPPIGLYSVFSKKSAGAYLKRYEIALKNVQQQYTYGKIFEKFIHDYKEKR